ncbi:MAG: response regulator transcription factor [Chitinophagaceae bacterium]|nr:response regulator transcription factor [Chitinophagaceae bacterium]
MIKAMIVEDKTAATELLRWLIRENCPEITSVTSAMSVKEALPLMDNFSPDILFLDIQLQHETGFDLLARVKKWNFEVVFTTAFNEYAIQAIRFSALDYLLKPVNGEDLKKAVERYKAKKQFAAGGEELYRNFIRNITQTDDKQFTLALRGVGEVQYVSLQDIIRLEADRNYTKLFFTNGKNFLASKTLAEYEKLLREKNFVRVHRSHLVNSKHIISYNKEGIMILRDQFEIDVSRRKKDFVSRFMEHRQAQNP